jgi:hypothetical protein
MNSLNSFNSSTTSSANSPITQPKFKHCSGQQGKYFCKNAANGNFAFCEPCYKLRTAPYQPCHKCNTQVDVSSTYRLKCKLAKVYCPSCATAYNAKQQKYNHDGFITDVKFNPIAQFYLTVKPIPTIHEVQEELDLLKTDLQLKKLHEETMKLKCLLLENLLKTKTEEVETYKLQEKRRKVTEHFKSPEEMINALYDLIK